MAEVSDIKWGGYSKYEGPFYRGKAGFRLPQNPTEDEKVLAVITATEGGHWDAYNGYDWCISTSGLIQWCNRAPQHSVDDLLGRAAEFSPSLIDPVKKLALSTGYSFRPNMRSAWRFFDSAGHEVKTPPQQQQMFLMCSGKKGHWNNAAKAHAKQWAAAISTVWENSTAQGIQCRYTVARLNSFALPTARNLFATMPETDVGYAFRSAYLSFAANNPSWANKSLKKALEGMTAPAWTEDWLTTILQRLTFFPGIAIYPIRYKAIRPVLEKLYGVDLPDFAKDLKNWKDENGFRDVLTTLQLQNALLTLGYDLGPAGADDKFGRKTQEALKAFEESANVPEEHRDGLPDRWTVPELERALEKKGLDLLS